MRGSCVIFDTNNSFYVYNSYVYTKNNRYERAIPYIYKNGKWNKCDVGFDLNLLDIEQNRLGDNSKQTLLYGADKIVGHKLNLFENGEKQIIDKNGNVIYIINENKNTFFDANLKEFFTLDSKDFTVKEE